MWMPPDPTFTSLFERHRGPVVRYLRRRLGDGAAEDAAVQVFRRARRSELDDRGEIPRPSIYALATEQISERWRTERRRLELFERLAHQPPAAHPALEPPRPLEPRVATTLRACAAVERETLLLIAWGELDRAAAATTLGISVRTVRARLDRAAARLQDSDVPPFAPFVDDDSVPGETADPGELLAVLADHADLGLDPMRQPRIESAVHRRFSAPTHPPTMSSGDLPPLGV